MVNLFHSTGRRSLIGFRRQNWSAVAVAVAPLTTADTWRHAEDCGGQQIGQQVVEHERRSEEVLARLSKDLTAGHGRGFSKRNIEQMRAFYQGWEIAQTPSAQFEAKGVVNRVGRMTNGEERSVITAGHRQLSPGWQPTRRASPQTEIADWIDKHLTLELPMTLGAG